MLLPPAYVLPKMVMGCLFSVVSHLTHQHPSTRSWKCDASEKVTCFQWAKVGSSVDSAVQTGDICNDQLSVGVQSPGVCSRGPCATGFAALSCWRHVWYPHCLFGQPVDQRYHTNWSGPTIASSVHLWDQLCMELQCFHIRSFKSVPFVHSWYTLRNAGTPGFDSWWSCLSSGLISCILSPWQQQFLCSLIANITPLYAGSVWPWHMPCVICYACVMSEVVAHHNNVTQPCINEILRWHYMLYIFIIIIIIRHVAIKLKLSSGIAISEFLNHTIFTM